MEATNTLKKIDSIVLSEYILNHYGPMSHLKLQKLLFYCDAYHMAYFGSELIPDTFQAWVHGPVCRKVYDGLKGESRLYADIVCDPFKADQAEKIFNQLTIDQRDLIGEVLDNLSGWTGMQLESATHSELPWIEARKGYSPADKCAVEISKETTKGFYRREMYGES